MSVVLGSGRISRDHRYLLAAAILLLAVSVMVVVLLGRWNTSSVPVEADRTAEVHEHPSQRVTGETSGLGTVEPALSGAQPRASRGGARVAHPAVRWEDGVPVEGAEIHVFVPDPAYQGLFNIKPRSWVSIGVKTDAVGGYRLPRQDICPLRLGASLDGEGWAEEWDRPVPKWETAPDQMRRDLVMRAVRVIEGTVVDPEGRGVAGATVSAAITWTLDEERIHGSTKEERTSVWWESVFRAWAHQTTSDDDGSFRLSSLVEEDWTLVAEADGYSYGLTEVSSGGLSVRDVRVVLADPECWTVRVTDDLGLAVSDAVVTVWPDMTATDRRQEVATDQGGLARVCEVEPQDANVQGDAADLVPSMAKNTEGETFFDLQLERAMDLVGTLVLPVAREEHCMFAHFSGRMMFPTEFTTDSDGRFEVRQVPPGAAPASISCKTGHLRLDVDGRPGEVRDLGLLTLITWKGAGRGHDLWGPAVMD